jgi:hypothetical protein
VCEGTEDLLDIEWVDPWARVGRPRRETLLALELAARQAERRSVDPRQRVADPTFVLDRAGERFGDRVLGQLPATAGEAVDRAPELRPGLAEQRLEVVLRLDGLERRPLRGCPSHVTNSRPRLHHAYRAPRGSDRLRVAWDFRMPKTVDEELAEAGANLGRIAPGSNAETRDRS